MGEKEPPDKISLEGGIAAGIEREGWTSDAFPTPAYRPHTACPIVKGLVEAPPEPELPQGSTISGLRSRVVNRLARLPIVRDVLSLPGYLSDQIRW